MLGVRTKRDVIMKAAVVAESNDDRSSKILFSCTDSAELIPFPLLVLTV